MHEYGLHMIAVTQVEQTWHHPKMIIALKGMNERSECPAKWK
jgi:hypothetical protein